MDLLSGVALSSRTLNTVQIREDNSSKVAVVSVQKGNSLFLFVSQGIASAAFITCDHHEGLHL